MRAPASFHLVQRIAAAIPDANHLLMAGRALLAILTLPLLVLAPTKATVRMPAAYAHHLMRLAGRLATPFLTKGRDNHQVDLLALLTAQFVKVQSKLLARHRVRVEIDLLGHTANAGGTPWSNLCGG